MVQLEPERSCAKRSAAAGVSVRAAARCCASSACSWTLARRLSCCCSWTPSKPSAAAAASLAFLSDVSVTGGGAGWDGPGSADAGAGKERWSFHSSSPVGSPLLFARRSTMLRSALEGMLPVRRSQRSFLVSFFWSPLRGILPRPPLSRPILLRTAAGLCAVGEELQRPTWQKKKMRKGKTRLPRLCRVSQVPPPRLMTKETRLAYSSHHAGGLDEAWCAGAASVLEANVGARHT